MNIDFYRDKKFNSYINYLLGEGYQSYSDLRDCEKDILLQHCLRISRDDFVEIFCINPDDIESALSKYLQTGLSEEAIDLAKVIRQYAHQYFEDSLTEYFEEAYQDRAIDIYRENGLKSHTDEVTGETLWL